MSSWLKAGGLLVFAGAVGALAVGTLVTVLTEYERQIEDANRDEDTVTVVVAQRDLYPGVTITEADLFLIELAPRYLPAGVFLAPEHVIGKRPRERILANDTIRADRLANPETGDGINAIIPRGLRAIAVELGGGAALSGLLEPGNIVDMLVTIDPDERGGEHDTETHTLAQGLFVLGVDGLGVVGDGEKRERGKPTVTLLVTPEQAEQVAHAVFVGDLHFALRTELDREFWDGSGIDIGALLGVYEAPRVRIRPVLRSKREITPVPTKVEPKGPAIKIIEGEDVEIFTPDGPK